MTDHVPPPESKDQGGPSPGKSDKDQPHRSDRQATVLDNQHKPSEKVTDLQGQAYSSDRQATAPDAQHKPSEKVTDLQGRVQRDKEWDALCKSEKARIDKLITEEKIPPGKLLAQNDSSLAHLATVVDVVNLALARSNPPSLEGKQSVQTRLEGARENVSMWREESKLHSESPILRDAERYLWARSGAEKFAMGSTLLAEIGYGLYDAAKIAAIITDSDSLKANKDLPFSARGGHDWFSLGLQHWDRFDKDSLNNFGDLKHLTYEDVIRYQDASAMEKEQEDDFNPNEGKWK